MILEALVTTLNADGSVNVAPMGPRVEGGEETGTLRTFLLRPFRSSTTYRNLARHPEGVLHVTDDVLMIARSAIGLDPEAETFAAGVVRGRVISGACRYHEFRAWEIDDRQDRVEIRCETVASGVLREFFGFNRAKHAAIEAAILATRIGLLDPGPIAEELRRLASPVEKTGGPREFEAFRLIVDHVRRKARELGHPDLEWPSS